VVEFFKIDRDESSLKKKRMLFRAEDGHKKTHPYLFGLMNELKNNHGIYIFFDSRGQAIYAGKARFQSLWIEMTAAFNRNRGEVQGIKRVNHPTHRVSYKTSDEKTRQIVERAVPLHELAIYFSAYRVDDAMINKLEALLVRSFANNLLNKRMEKF